VGTVVSALGLLWDEFALLTAETARTLRRLWAPVLGLMLLGWSANELSVLLATDVSPSWPWLVLVVLAVGMVLQLATILAVLRLTAVHLGLPAMLSRASVGAEVDDARDTSPVHLLTITLLPFLGMYAAFGFVSDYAANLVKLSAYRKGLGNFVTEMNPVENPSVLVWTLGLLAAGYVFGKLIDPWRARTRHPLAVGVLQILVEAVLALLTLLVAFRIYEQVSLWLSDRAYQAWFDQAIGMVGGWVRIDLPVVLTSAWDFVAGTLWPLVFGGLTRPLLWLAMAGLVFGARVLSLADLWRLGEPASGADTRRERMLARLRADTEQARGIRLIALRAQGFFLGGLDGKIIPAWQSLRLVLRAGWPFLGAFVIAFTIVDVAGDQLRRLVIQAIGGHPIHFWLRLLPFIDALKLVLVMGVLWVLLTVAYTRALSIFAERTADDVEPVLVAGTADVRRAFRSRPVEAVTAIVVATLVVVGLGRLPSSVGHEVVVAPLETRAELQGQQVLVGEPRLARAVTMGSQEITTDRVFVVVPVGVATPGSTRGLVQARLVAGERSYPAWAGAGPPATAPGFSAVAEMLFEVDPADIGPATTVVLEPGEVVQSYQQWVHVPLGFAEGQAASAVASTPVETTPYRAAA
jgi:hypothetical protein